MKIRCLPISTLIFAVAWVAAPARAQNVVVTLRLDAPTISVGDRTTLRVFAQVVPAQRAGSERIFSWHLDFLNDSSSVAQADYDGLLRPASDKHPLTSSSGQTEGSHRRGIYDTFISDSPRSMSGIGVDSPVELFSVPVLGLSLGRATFRVRPGSGTGLAEDFIVAEKVGDEPLVGGVYDSATVELDVTESAGCTPKPSLKYSVLAGRTNKVTLTFLPCAGQSHVVEFRDKLDVGSWQLLAPIPVGSGTAIDTNTVAIRFYRVRSTP